MLKQLSVFVENKPGSLMEVTSRLTEAHVNIRAVASFDTPEFGILRLIVDKPAEAKGYLTERGFVVRVSDVIGVELEDKKGQSQSDVGNTCRESHQCKLHLLICNPRRTRSGSGI